MTALKEPRPGNGASDDAIRAHYDVGNAFYAAWLDRTMTYSAARWDHAAGPPLSLEAAQTAKLDWHLDHCRSEGGTLIDVGCGWGSLMARALETGAAGRCIGLTPSLAQSEWITTRLGHLPIDVRLQAWAAADVSGHVDGIAAIGSLEHFARPGLGSEARTEAYRCFFLRCHRLLPPRGPLSVQFISWADGMGSEAEEYLPRVLFPESTLPHCPEIESAMHGLFRCVAHENRPEDYSRTLAAWLARMTHQRANLIDRFGKEVFKIYSRAFRKFILGFEGGTLDLHRMRLVRV